MALGLIAIFFTTSGADSGGVAAAATSAGQFHVQCLGPVLSQSVDPIMRAASHKHEFYGSRAISLNATYQDLRAGSSACATPTHLGDEPGDTASYWAPTLYVSGVRLPVPKSTFYYTGGEKRPPLTTWPARLKIIAGNAKATTPQSKEVVYWGCGSGSSATKVTTPPQCSSGDTGLTLHVNFPDCWNGRDLDSSDHKSHMAYSKNRACPASHAVSLPRLIARFQWTDKHPSPVSLSLSSGSTNTFHADWWNSWDQTRLAKLVDKCINAGLDCKL